MEIAKRAVNTARILTILAFLVALTWVYAYLPTVMEVFLFDQATKLVVVSKQVYFYGALAVFVLFNVLIHIYRVTVTKMKPSGTLFYNEGRKAVFGLWLGILQICINILLIGFYVFYGVQACYTQFSPIHFFPLLIVGPVLVLLSFVLLGILMARPLRTAHN